MQSSVRPNQKRIGQKRRIKNIAVTILPPPTLAGLFFCLASAEGAGLLFFPAAIQPHTSIYSVFCAVNAVIPPTPQNNAQGFTMAFPEI